MNNCSFVGRITKEPESKETTSGKNYTRFTIAIDDGKDSNGNKRTEFVNFIAWGKCGEIVSNYAHKGDAVEVTGRYHTTSYEGEDGNKRSYTDIIVTTFFIISHSSKSVTETAPEPPQEPIQPTEEYTGEQLPLPFEI